MAGLQYLAYGFAHFFVFKTVLLMLGGVCVGLVIGALPGLSATMGVALFLPVTYWLSPSESLVFLGSLYMAAIYGGSFSAILLRTPGTPSNIGTTFDGYPMAKQGRGWEAILTATFSSLYGGLFGLIMFLIFAPMLARVALKFGPPEYFWLGIFGLTVISSLSRGNTLKGFIGGLIGVLLSTVGVAPVGGNVRFTFNIPELIGGVGLIPALVGLFCIPEVIDMVLNRSKKQLYQEARVQEGMIWKTFVSVMKKQVDLLRASIIGFIIGVLPGAGGNIANLVAYSEAVRASKHPEKFGTGIPEGVIATETSNNAVVGGGFVPLMTLGVPGTPVDAILYGALLMQGLRPGAELFTRRADVVYTFIAGVIVATFVMVPIGLAFGRAMAKFITKIPLSLLAPTVLFLTMVGSYCVSNNISDVYMMLILGVLGFVLRKLGFEAGPITLGLILGPIIETGLVQGLLIGRKFARPWLIFFARPLCWVFIVLSVFFLFWPVIMKKRMIVSGGDQR
ncbi:tripartite tricarboxylate transporter permease [Thermotoga caldifontis]|uniref:tripartite tricarboxylate transporter permease n=1 Tax=Thermotoga caldifontis TaxID=1508419 RepID=UPI0005979CCC|nr:tripartite tricarboxylate transporter permease [Thermotoga caldifontis]